MTDESDTSRCPNCGNDYKSLGSHWAASSTCDHPRFTPTQREILSGLLIGRGTIKWKKKASNPEFNVSLANRRFLEWLNDQFGILARGIFDIDEVNHFAEVGTMHRFSLRSLPELASYHQDWYTEDRAKHTPSDIVPSPLLLKVWYGTAGNLYNRGRVRAAGFSLESTNISDDTLHRLLGDFGLKIATRTTDDGTERTAFLQDTAEFFDHISRDRALGDSPLPGYEHKWPDNEGQPLAELTERSDPCPECGVEFNSLSNHWSNSESCTYPELTTEQTSVMTGAFLMGASLVVDSGKNSSLSFTAANEAVIDYLDDSIGWLSRHDKRFVDGQDVTTSMWSADFDGVYRLTTRTHPWLSRFSSWLTETQNKRGTQTRDFPEGGITRSPTLVQAMYVYRGRYISHSHTKRPAFSLAPLPSNHDKIRDLFAPFDPLITKRYAVIRDKDSFFDYIGDAPQGLKYKWIDRTNEPETAKMDEPLAEIFRDSGGSLNE